MQHFFIWSGHDLLCFGLLNIGNKNTSVDMALPLARNTESVLLKHKLCWYCDQVVHLKPSCHSLASGPCAEEWPLAWPTGITGPSGLCPGEHGSVLAP